LRYAVENGIIDITLLKVQVEEMKKKELLENYKYQIWQGIDGKWYSYKMVDGKRKLIRKSTKESVENAIIENLGRLAPTLSELFYEWINEKLEMGEIVKGTADRYVNDYKRYYAEFGEMQVSKIDEDLLDEFIRYTVKHNTLSNKGFSNLRTITIGVFKYARRKKYTDINIVTFFQELDISRKAFKKKPKSIEEQIFSEEEMNKLLDYFDENPTVENLALKLAFQTGVRCGELATLKFSDFDVNRRTLHIQRMEQKYKGENKGEQIHEVVPFTKTDAGNRYIILPDSAIETIYQIHNMNPDGEYLFMLNGKRLITNIYNDRLYKACRECHILERSMHKIRKTYGTMLIDGGADESLIMSQMGHSDITTTKKYYYFANKNMSKKVEQINRALDVFKM